MDPWDHPVVMVWEKVSDDSDAGENPSKCTRMRQAEQMLPISQMAYPPRKDGGQAS